MGNTPNNERNPNPSQESFRVNEVDVDREILRLQQQIEKSPETGAFYEQLGHLYYQKGQSDEAEVNLIKAHQLIPVSAKTVFVLGLLKQEKGDYIEAIEYFRETIDRDENNPEPYHKLAEIFLSKREVDKAIYYATECSKFKQSDADLNNLVGLCYLQKNNLEKAQEYLQTANLLDANHFRVLNNLGNLNRKLNKLDRAIDYYRLSIKNMPNFFPAYLNLGLAFLDKGDIWNALLNLKESLKGGSEIKEYISRQGLDLFINDDVLYNGIKFCHEEQFDIAAIFLEQAFQNNSKNIVTIFYIATLKFKLKEFQVAANLFNEVIDILINQFAHYKRASWFRVLYETSKDRLHEIQEKYDDTVNLSEYNPVDKLSPRKGRDSEGEKDYLQSTERKGEYMKNGTIREDNEEISPNDIEIGQNEGNQ